MMSIRSLACMHARARTHKHFHTNIIAPFAGERNKKIENEVMRTLMWMTVLECFDAGLEFS